MASAEININFILKKLYFNVYIHVTGNINKDYRIGADCSGLVIPGGSSITLRLRK